MSEGSQVVSEREGVDGREMDSQVELPVREEGFRV